MAVKVFPFLQEKFDRMPQWVQVTTYLLLLVLFLYLALSPRFIDVRLIAEVGDREIPLGGAEIEVETSDRVFYMATNGEGRLSVPLTLANPLQSYTFMLRPDVKQAQRVEVEARGHMAFTGWNRLVYSRDRKALEFAGVPASDRIAGLIPSARADSPCRPEAEIPEAVYTALADVTGAGDIDESTPLDELGAGNVELSYVHSELVEGFGVDAWDEIYRNAETAGEIAAIARRHYAEGECQ